LPKTLLLIAKNWPEPNSTAAGRRTLDLLSLFQAQGWEVHVASAAEFTPFQHDLSELSFTAHKVILNDRSFDAFISRLHPSLVIYDRFVTEEQFGWRVRQTIPSAMTLLDTSDLHCLRHAREQVVKKSAEFNLNNDIALREIAAIVRCDFTLMISRVEIDLLTSHFQLPSELLGYLPFLVSPEDVSPSPSFAQRQHCVMIGGFKHEPNRDATRWLKTVIWPQMQKHLPPNTEMHVYGAYADHAMNQLNNPKQRFFIKGRAEHSLETLSRYRLNLAPLRFGAGQKGKILEGWLSGTATLANSVAMESMATKTQLVYDLPDSPEDFATLANSLYNDEVQWQKAVQNGFGLLRENFDQDRFGNPVIKKIENIHSALDQHRARNFWGQMLWQNQFKAHEFMSRWIELKNAQKD
jgi:hypothetical protein